MFDNGVIHLIEGNDIDRPRNAITLTRDLHDRFGKFDIFFEPLSGQEDHTYQIRTFLHPTLMPDLPVVRTLDVTEDRNIEPPSSRILALHRTIAHILHLSAAGDYMDKILKDMEWKDTRADGSTELGRLVDLRLNGWLDHAVYTEPPLISRRNTPPFAIRLVFMAFQQTRAPPTRYFGTCVLTHSAESGCLKQIPR